MMTDYDKPHVPNNDFILLQSEAAKLIVEKLGTHTGDALACLSSYVQGMGAVSIAGTSLHFCSFFCAQLYIEAVNRVLKRLRMNCFQFYW